MILSRLIFLLLTYFLIWQSSFAQLPGWKGALYFEVNNGSNAEDLDDYQVRLTFNHKVLVDRGDSKADGSDLRVSDCKGNPMHFWIERGKNTTGTVCWVKVPFLAARARDIIMISYGKSNTLGVENADSVFDFFDDFENLNITQIKWDRAFNATITGGWIKPYRENDDWGGSNYMYCKKNLSYLNNRGIVECEVRSRKDNVGGNVIFYVNDPKASNHYMIQHDTRFLNNTDGDFGFRAGPNGGEVLPRYVYKWDKDERVFYQLKIIGKNNLYHYRYSNTSGNRRISGSIYPTTSWNWNYIGLSAMSIFDYSFEVSYIWVRKYTPVEPSVYARDMNVVTSTPGFVDFGWLVCDNEKEVTISLRNIGSDKVNITECFYQKGYQTKYEFKDFDTLTFNPGESKNVTLKFNAKLPGRYEDTIILVNNNPCASNLYIPMLAIKDSVLITTNGLVNDTLDFGSICLNKAVDSSFKIINKSSISTFIRGSQLDTIFLYKGNNPFLSAMEINEERKVNVTFTGSPVEGVYYDSLTIIDTCGREKKVYLKVAVGEPVFELANNVIDFGDVILPCDSTKTLYFNIENNSPFEIPGIVNSYSLKGQFANNGICTTELTENDTVIAGTNKAYGITFQPQKPGLYEGELNIIMEPCDVEKKLTLLANVLYVQFRGQRDGVDFGMVRLNSYRDSTIVFENTGTAKIEVNNLSGITQPFEIISTVPQIPAILNPGDSIKVLVRFNSKDTLQHTSYLELSGIPCSFTDRVLLRGAGLPIIAEALVFIPNTHGKTGEKITIPLVLESSNNLIQSGIDAFEATIEMNRTLLKPINLPDSSISINADTRQIHLNGIWNSPNGVLYNMEFVPALGDSVCTDMKITDFRWLNGLSKVSLISGRFCLVDICYEGGPRLFEESNELKLEVSPIPASESISIKIGIIEEGATRLSLFDFLGNRKAEIVNYALKSGIYEYNYPAADLSSGIYYLLLETPTQCKSELVRIIR